MPYIAGTNSPICSLVPLALIAAAASPVPIRASADAGVAPEQLLLGDDHAEAGVVEPLLRHEVDGVDADLGGLLDDRPGGLLALVPLVGGGADHLGGEVVQPLLQGDLVLGEVERELGHGVLLSGRSDRCGIGARLVRTMVLPAVTSVKLTSVERPDQSQGWWRAGAGRSSAASLLEAADRVVQRDGPDASMNVIAAEAGITKPILYRHFGDKGGLYRALAARHIEELLARLRAALLTRGGLEARTRATVDAYLAADRGATADLPVPGTPGGGRGARRARRGRGFRPPVRRRAGDRHPQRARAGRGRARCARWSGRTASPAWCRRPVTGGSTTQTSPRATVVDELTDLLVAGFLSLA